MSVIIGVHNGERFLPDTLRSVLAQDYTNFELIVVDDGSSDESVLILERIGDPRMRIVRKLNGGSASATAAGLAVSSGEYIAFLDQDDLWLPDKLRSHMDVMRERPEIALTFSWFSVIDDRNREMGIHSARVDGTVSFRDLLIDFVIGGTSNVVARRDAIERAGGPDAAIPGMYDLDLFVRIALLAPGNILAIPRKLIRYRRHANQLTRNIGAMEAEWNATLEKLRAIAPRDVKPVERRARSNMNRYFARLCYEGGHYAQGLRFLKRGFQLAPANFLTDFRNWLTIAACLSGCVLPSRLLRAAERLAGLRRD